VLHVVSLIPRLAFLFSHFINRNLRGSRNHDLCGLHWNDPAIACINRLLADAIAPAVSRLPGIVPEPTIAVTASQVFHVASLSCFVWDRPLQQSINLLLVHPAPRFPC
jgi:hypothetical protein